MGFPTLCILQTPIFVSQRLRSGRRLALSFSFGELGAAQCARPGPSDPAVKAGSLSEFPQAAGARATVDRALREPAISFPEPAPNPGPAAEHSRAARGSGSGGDGKLCRGMAAVPRGSRVECSFHYVKKHKCSCWFLNKEGFITWTGIMRIYWKIYV